jgi:hypothetical protein
MPPDWRSNAVGVIPNPGNFSQGLHITRWFTHNGTRAAEAIPSEHNAADCSDVEMPGCEITKIPTYGFAVQGRLFLAFMSVHHWGDPGKWAVNYSSFAMSSNAGAKWTVKSRMISWGQKSNFAQVAVTPDATGKYLLFYGIPGGRFGSAKLMRCPNRWQSVLDPKAYQYYTGTSGGQPAWSTDQTKAVTVAGAPVGELSVIYDRGLKQWLMTYLQGAGNIVIRSAPNYWGPWSAPATLASQTRFPGLYGAFMNARFVSNGGGTIYFVMSQWGPYSVFWMRATLARRPAS